MKKLLEETKNKAEQKAQGKTVERNWTEKLFYSKKTGRLSKLKLAGVVFLGFAVIGGIDGATEPDNQASEPKQEQTVKTSETLTESEEKAESREKEDAAKAKADEKKIDEQLKAEQEKADKEQAEKEKADFEAKEQAKKDAAAKAAANQAVKEQQDAESLANSNELALNLLNENFAGSGTWTANTDVKGVVSLEFHATGDVKTAIEALFMGNQSAKAGWDGMVTTAEGMSSSVSDLYTTFGHDETVLISVLNPLNEQKTLLTITDGVTTYNFADELE